jgi:hypothetical protein
LPPRRKDQEAEAHRGPALFSNDELEQRLIATVFTAAVNRMRIPAYRERVMRQRLLTALLHERGTRRIHPEWVHPHNGQNVMQDERVQAVFLAAIQFGRGSLMVDATAGVPTEWATRAAAWFLVHLPRMGYALNATFAPTQAFVAAHMQRFWERVLGNERERRAANRQMRAPTMTPQRRERDGTPEEEDDDEFAPDF